MQYFLLTGIILSIFHSFVLFSKSEKTTTNYLLGFWFCFSGIPLFSYFLVYTEQYLSFPSLTVLGMPLPLATGPLLFLYTKYQTIPISFDKIDLLHFVPLVIVFLLYIDFYFLPFETRALLLKNNGQGYETKGLIKLIAIYISGIVYIPCTLIQLLKYRRNLTTQFSNTERINFNWLLYQIIGMAVIWIVILFNQDDRFIFGSVSLFIIWISYFGSKQVGVYNQNYRSLGTAITETKSNEKILEENNLSLIEPETFPSTNEIEKLKVKYEKSTLSEVSALKIYEDLQEIMHSDKLFRNAELTLDELPLP